MKKYSDRVSAIEKAEEEAKKKAEEEAKKKAEEEAKRKLRKRQLLRGVFRFWWKFFVL